MKVLFCVCLCWLLASAEYSGYKVVRAYLENEKQIAEVNTWELDVWTRDSSLGIGWNDIVVNSNHVDELFKLNISFNTFIDDLAQHLSEGKRDLERSRADKDGMLADFFTAYHTYDEFVAYLTNLTNSYPTISKFIPSIGTSIEKRNIFALTITGTATGAKKKIFVNGGQHAREWIAPATTMYILTQLITRYGNDAAVTQLLNSAVFHFVPLVNVDGYAYTWTAGQRLWRKNRRPNQGGSFGVDLNRNWDDHWGGEGSSGTPSSDTYRGTAPFSEPESKAVADYVAANKPFVGAIDYHSYSQYILRPYAWSKNLPPNDAIAKSVGDTMATRTRAVNNVAYTSQAWWQMYYASGVSTDWYYTTAGIPLSYCIELRDTGTYGFQLPAAQIKPTGAENWAGFLYFAQSALSQ